MYKAIFLIWPMIFYALAASAEPVWQVASDLNGNGVDETVRLIERDDNQIDLIISEKGNTLADVADFTWMGGLYGQIPELAVTPHGSVQVISMNEGCCRSRWTMTVTIAYRKEAYRVAGITYVWRDTLDLDEWGVCDVNLLTGRGSLTKGDRPARPIRVTETAVTVAEWSVNSALPKACDIY